MACTVFLGCGGDDSGDAPSTMAGAGGSPMGGQGGAAGTMTGGFGGAGAGGAGGAGGQGGSAGESPEDIGTFTGLVGFDRKLAVESSIACAIGATGEITCQGPSLESWDPPPAGPFERIAMGDNSICALDAQGNATCWGNVFNDLEAPAGPFTALAVQGDAACGLRPSGRIRCWGDDWGGFLEAPEGVFTDLVMQHDGACALATDHVQCWGDAFIPHGRVDGAFTQLSLMRSNLCTLDAAGKIACHDSNGDRYADRYSVGTYVTLGVGGSHVCGLKADGAVDCFDDDSIGRLPPPLGPWVELAGWYSAECARAADGRVECWGSGWGDGAAMLDCKMGLAKLTGTVDGDAFETELESSNQYSLSDVADGYRFAYSTGAYDGMNTGLMVFDGDAMLGYDSSPERALAGKGEVPITRSVLQLGGSLTEPGELLCTGEDSGSTMSLNIDEISLDLQNVHSLGTCPGTPVDGELTFCGVGTCEHSLSGTLEGMAVEGSLGQGGLASSDGISSWYGDDRDLLRVVTDDVGHVVWAIYVAGPDSPLAGSVYCAGEGSTNMVTQDETAVYTLRNLSKLAACPSEASTDSLMGCTR